MSEYNLKRVDKTQIKIEKDFIINRIAHPSSVTLNLKGYTIKNVLWDMNYEDFYVYFVEVIDELQDLDYEIWFSKELNENEYNRMRQIIDGEKQ